MRMFTLNGMQTGATFPDGSAAPPMPRSQSIPLSAIFAVTLLPVLKAGTPNVIEAQLLTLQLTGGMSLPLTLNKAPSNAGNRQIIDQKFAALRDDLADDSKLKLDWTYEELT